MKKKLKNNISFNEVSQLIIESIEQEQFFNKETLVPKVKAILRGFNLNLSITNYDKVRSPSEIAKLIRSFERVDKEMNYWKQLVRKLDPNNIQKYYTEVDSLKRDWGFTDIKETNNELS